MTASRISRASDECLLVAETGRIFLYHSDHDINKLDVNTLTPPPTALAGVKLQWSFRRVSAIDSEVGIAGHLHRNAFLLRTRELLDKRRSGNISDRPVSPLVPHAALYAPDTEVSPWARVA